MVSRHHFTFKRDSWGYFWRQWLWIGRTGRRSKWFRKPKQQWCSFLPNKAFKLIYRETHRYEKQYLDMPVELKTFSHVQAWNNTYPKQINTCLALLYCNGALPKTSSGFCDFLISNVTQQVWTLLLFVKMYCVRPHTTIVQYRPQALQHYTCVSRM